MTVRFDIEVRTSLEINMPEFFLGVKETQRRAYWELDIGDWDCDSEYERPLAWIMSCYDDDVFTPYISDSGVSMGYTDIDWSSYRSSMWSEDHFDALVAEVPWLKPPVDGDEIDDEDLARMPGPGDRPLF